MEQILSRLEREFGDELEEKVLEERFNREDELRELLVRKRVLIASEGNIGLGKSSIMKMLKAVGLKVLEELDDPAIQELLPKYYADMKTYAYQIQHEYFRVRSTQLEMADNLIKAANVLDRYGIQGLQLGSIGMDRTIYADPLIFARVLHEAGNFDDWYFNKYMDFFDHRVRTLP